MTTSDPFAGVPDPLRQALQDRGFTSLTAIQRAVLAADADGSDLRISSQTGSGKTVALGLALARYWSEDGTPRPIVAKPEPKAESEPDAEPTQVADGDAAPDATAEPEPKPVKRSFTSPRPSGPTALIITPTRELAVQVRTELQWLYANLRATRVEVVTGGTDLGGERRMLRRPPSVLVGTPGRLLDHIRASAVRCDGIQHVVLDEADRMLDMGFKDELEAIVEALPSERRTHLVSATFSGVMRHIANRFQNSAQHLEGTALGEANEDIDHIAQLVLHEERYAALVNALLLAQGQRALIFVERRDGASQLAEELAGDGFAALPFSGELSQAQRTRTLDAFRTGTIQALVATDVAARGIDVPGIMMVVHMAPPQDPDVYTHRSGRTGRAGQRGRSLLLVPPRAQRYVARLLANARVNVEWQSVPTPAKIRKAITKRTRRDLHTRLDAEQGPAEKTLVYARQMLEERDPAMVIAALLEMAEPRLPREPMATEAVTVQPPAAYDSEPRNHRRGPRSNDDRRRPHRGRPQGRFNRRDKAPPKNK